MTPPPAPVSQLSTARLARLALAIEDHLARHPQAADSVDGVARWWLGARGRHASPADVERALATLVAQQRLRCVRLADGTVLYSRHEP